MQSVFLVLGGISGTSFLLTLSTLSYWLSESGLSKTTIGLFVITTLPYSLKFIFPPFLEKVGHYFFGSSWAKKSMMLAQTFLGLSFVLLGSTDPNTAPLTTAGFAFSASMFAAIYDCLMDGIRLDLVPPQNTAWIASIETIGFRIGMICGGAGALYIAYFASWFLAYTAIGLTIWVVGLITIWAGLPNDVYKHKTASFTYKQTWKTIKSNTTFPTLLLWIALFKWGDTIVNAMVSPFLWEMGYSKLEVANITKSFGLSLTVIGSLFSALFVRFFGLAQASILCSVGQAVSCLLFVIQTWAGYQIGVLVIVIGIESFVSGLSNAMFLIVLSHVARKGQSPMSQFVIFCSFGSFIRVIGSSSAGLLADSIGWAWLFGLSSLTVLPIRFYMRFYDTVASQDLENDSAQHEQKKTDYEPSFKGQYDEEKKSAEGKAGARDKRTNRPMLTNRDPDRTNHGSRT